MVAQLWKLPVKPPIWHMLFLSSIVTPDLDMLNSKVAVSSLSWVDPSHILLNFLKAPSFLDISYYLEMGFEPEYKSYLPPVAIIGSYTCRILSGYTIISIYTVCMYIYIHTLHYIALHYIALHYIALHYIPYHIIPYHIINKPYHTHIAASTSFGARSPGGSDDHNHKDPGAHAWLSGDLQPTLGPGNSTPWTKQVWCYAIGLRWLNTHCLSPPVETRDGTPGSHESELQEYLEINKYILWGSLPQWSVWLTKHG